MNKPKAIIDLENLEFTERKRIWKPFMEKYDCRVICELGIREGKNFKLMIEHTPKEAVAVDAWIDDGTDSHNDLGFTQEDLDNQYQKFSAEMSDNNFVKIYREYTFDAVKRFPDEYFDLVYIDADHTYVGCSQDIADWFPKIKSGRFLIGDDYIAGTAHETGVRFRVIEAVNNFAKINKLEVFELPLFGWAIIKP